MKISLVLTIIATAVLTVNCNGGGTVTTSPPGGGTTPPSEPSSTIVYGNHFFSRDSSASQSLLQACNRCGRKWLSPNKWGGGNTYHKCSWLSSDSPLKCQNWSSQGYIQIEFAAKKLPTTATVTIWPQYIYRSHEKWGQSFSVKGEAHPINENKGFSIQLPPSSGLGGLKTLYVESQDTNHIHGGSLNVEARYGGGSEESNVVFSADSMPRVKKNPPSLYSCRQRPPDLMSTGSLLSFCLSFGG